MSVYMYESDSTEIARRLTINDLVDIKEKVLNQIHLIQKTEDELEQTFQQINGHAPCRIEWRFDNYATDNEVKCVDQKMWRYLIDLLELRKFMLCTEFNRMEKQIDDFDFPVFNFENATAWVDSLKSLIHDNVKTLIKKVYQDIIQGCYYTGSSRNSSTKKKRNNNGIDQNFILTTNDYGRVFMSAYHYNYPTILDDLEKVIYILNGESLPEFTLKDQMRKEKSVYGENEYMKIKVCKNGNTHFWLTDETRNKLNLYGPEGNEIGQNIKIKVFEDRW